MSIELSSNLSPNVKFYFLDSMGMIDEVTDPETLFDRPPLTYVECYEANKEMCRLTGINIMSFATLQAMTTTYDYVEPVEQYNGGFRLVIEHPSSFLKEVLEDMFNNSVFKDIYIIHDVVAPGDNPRQLHVDFAFGKDVDDLRHLVVLMQQGLDQPFCFHDVDGCEYDAIMNTEYQKYLADQPPATGE